MAQLDNYLPCEAYAAATESSKYAGFNAWLDGDTGSHYFAAVTNQGTVQLRSEAYTTESARDNGIESVMKNRDLEERYKVVQDPDDGQWYIVLRAGNNQEIARSCAYDSEAAAMAGIATCFSTYTERSVSTGIIDDYLPCEAYAAAPGSNKYAGFNAWLDNETGIHYFAAVTNQGSVQLRSEAYTTESARDNGIESVMKNRDLEERYKVVQDPDDDQWYIVLRAGNNQEIARSCAYDSEAAAMAGIATCFSTYQEKSASTPAVIEDYLPCEAYANKQVAADYEGFTQFQDETTGLHYFAMVDKNGHVVLKSEGYKTPASRDNGIESVIRNRDIEERWVKSKDDEGHYLSLRAGNHQEIARTCDFDSEGAMMGWWLPFAAGAYAWGRSDVAKAVPIAAVAEKISAAAVPAAVAVAAVAEKLAAAPTPPPAPPVVVSTKKEAAPPPPPPVAAYREAEPAAAGGSNWWKWLLPLLLLLGLLWFLRGCDGCKKAEVPTPAVSVAPPPVAVDTVKTAAAPTPPPAAAAPTCNCSAQTDVVFKLPTTTSAKKLSRLGTNPEFGNSHGLSPEEFFQKLSSRHAANATDRAFLDRMYRAMGYANGFAAAKADQFSAVTLPQGSTGNLGYGKSHGTGYYQLPDDEHDRQAFHLKAANGCDLHFMKTCGNHFFFCPK